MSKLLNLGAKLRYPITISKLMKAPGDRLKKQEPILQYKFKWMKKVGDPFGEEWEEEQTTIADWDSPADGELKSWRVEEGQIITKDMKFVEIEEDCPHSIQFQGLCGMCGKDMTEMSWASAGDDTSRAQINMIHDQTALRVSEEEASRAEEELQRRLLKHRKLSLVVDLDQTIIHACIEPTVGEWQRDPTNPNYEAVKDVRSFQLNDDGPRGLASGCSYYIKMRPGLKEFLNKVAELFELHVYTMGTRAYAMNIAKIVDADKRLFGDRIISRDENGNISTKSLARLFPVDTKMVCIIDDRADVWPKNRPNLIKVVPYDFFLGIGDINSSFLPKREELPTMTSALTKTLNGEEKVAESTAADPSLEVKTTDNGKDVEMGNTPDGEAGEKVSALEELVRMGGGDDQALRLEQAAEQEKSLEKQLTERPLLQMQEKLDNEEVEDGIVVDEKENGIAHERHRHNLLKDDDVELMYLEKHLSQLHKAFYDEYDSALVNASGSRVAQLKPGNKKKVSMKQDAADLKIVPDVGIVMPRLKRRTLAGCTIVTSGLVPLGSDVNRTEIGIQITSFGATLGTKVTKNITHLVVSPNSTRTNKVRQAARYPNIKIVNSQWLLDSMSRWEKVDEEPYEVKVPQSDRRARSYESSLSGSEEEQDIGVYDIENEHIISASQDTATDDEDVMPDDMQEGHSPIDDLKTFDWGEADDELKEFMGSDDESGEDTDSETASTRNGSVHDASGNTSKRSYDEMVSDDDSQSENQRLRLPLPKRPHTTLSEVTAPSDSDSAPTAATEEDFDEADLEALLEAEFDRLSEEENTNGVDGGGGA